jgi:hypothetical protein
VWRTQNSRKKMKLVACQSHANPGHARACRRSRLGGMQRNQEKINKIVRKFDKNSKHEMSKNADFSQH